MITDTFSESKQAANARSAYVSLCQIASDEQSDTFTVTKALISHKAGVSVKTVERLLPGFEALGLVRIDPNDAPANSGTIKAANTYTLLALRHGDVTTLRHGGTSTKSDKVEESGKKEKKGTAKSGLIPLGNNSGVDDCTPSFGVKKKKREKPARGGNGARPERETLRDLPNSRIFCRIPKEDVSNGSKHTNQGERGYSLDGRFLPKEAASGLLADNPDRANEILDKLVPAIRRKDGRIEPSLKS